MQTQKITETAFYGKVFTFKQSHGGLGKRHRDVERERAVNKQQNPGVVLCHKQVKANASIST